MITLGHKTSFILVDRAVGIHAYIKNYTTGNNQFLATNEILTSVLSNTFCEMRELISFCRGKSTFLGWVTLRWNVESKWMMRNQMNEGEI